MTEQVDVVVVGMGVGGEEVAGRLAEAGLSVVGIESRLVGGECPYWGCVPSKMMIRAGNLLAEARRIDGMAGKADAAPDWTLVARRIRNEATDNWSDRSAVDRFTGKGGVFVRGRGQLLGGDRVRVGDQVFEARRAIVLGTGTEPTIPPVAGLANTPYWTSRQAIEMEYLPHSLVVLGGGAIGLELAQAFARFGVQVTIVEASDRVLATEEPESSALAQRALESEGVDILTSCRAERVNFSDGQFIVHIGQSAPLVADRLLVATGRRVNLAGLGVENVGLDPNAKVLAADDQLRAGDRLWAVGDVTGHGAFTHVAMYQAGIVVRDILDQDGPPADYRALPRVTFTDPEIGAVGMTEQSARDHGINVMIGQTRIPSSSRGWIHKAGNEGFIKLVADVDRGLLIGATSAGPNGGEVLAGLAVAVHGEVPISKLRHMIYAYPTFHRAIEDALKNLDLR